MELQRNRELSRELYSLRGEAPPNDNACVAAHYLRRRHTTSSLGCARISKATSPHVRRSVHSMLDEPSAEARSRSWEVYGSMPGMDSLYTGASKRTPTGGFFTS